jgi:hypothetical protein
MNGPSWWVFDRPLLRDPLFRVGLVLGAVFLVVTVARLDDFGWFAAALNIAFALPAGVLVAGAVGGSVRRYRLARRGQA